MASKNIKFLFLTIAISLSTGLLVPIITELTYPQIDIIAISFTTIIYIASFIFIKISSEYFYTLFSPPVLMIAAWVPVLTLHNLQLSPAFLEVLSVETWTLILYTFLAFCITSFITALNGSRKRNESESNQITGLYPNYLKIIIYLFFGIGFLALNYNIFVRGGLFSLPIFVGVETKWTYLIPVFGQLVVLIDVAVLWAILFLMIFGSKNNTFLWIIIGFGLVKSIILYTRSDLFSILIASLFLFILVKGTHSIPKLRTVLLLISIFIIFQVISSLSGGFDRSQELSNQGKITVPHYSLAYPYVYLTTSITNLQLNIKYTNEFTHGLRSFGPLLSMLQVIEVDSLPRYITKWGGGIVPYQGTLFIDFGYNGVIIGPIILGAISGLTFRSIMKEKKSILSVVIYAILSTAIITSSITNWFALGRTWFYVLSSIALYLSYLFITRNRVNPINYNSLPIINHRKEHGY